MNNTCFLVWRTTWGREWKGVKEAGAFLHYGREINGMAQIWAHGYFTMNENEGAFYELWRLYGSYEQVRGCETYVNNDQIPLFNEFIAISSPISESDWLALILFVTTTNPRCFTIFKALALLMKFHGSWGQWAAYSR